MKHDQNCQNNECNFHGTGVEAPCLHIGKRLRGYTVQEAPPPFITLHFNHIDNAVRPFDIHVDHIHRIERCHDDGLNETEIVVGDELFRCVEDREEVHKKILNCMEAMKRYSVGFFSKYNKGGE